MITLLLTSIFLVTLYVGVTIGKTSALPDSISAMVYVFPRGFWQWLWTIWMWAVAFTTCIPVIEALSEKGLEVFGFFALISLSFVGAWPLFIKEMSRPHNILSVIAGIFTQVCVLFVCPWWLLLWTLMALAWWEKSKAVLISEAVCYGSLIGSALTYFLS